ncbi:hypothetical protein MPER_00906, partial [Moniliophthora perniciosa FA553]
MVRFKNRWLLIEFLPLDQLSNSTQTLSHIEGKHIWGAIKQSVITHFGDVGWGCVGLSLT